MAKIDKYSMVSRAFDAGQFNSAAFQVVKREYTRRGIPENECLQNLRTASLRPPNFCRLLDGRVMRAHFP